MKILGWVEGFEPLDTKSAPQVIDSALAQYPPQTTELGICHIRDNPDLPSARTDAWLTLLGKCDAIAEEVLALTEPDAADRLFARMDRLRPARVLMENGVWLVPISDRPALAPPPVESEPEPELRGKGWGY